MVAAPVKQSIYDRIGEFIRDEPDAESEDIAASLMKVVTKADLYPLLLEAVRGARRNSTRYTEQTGLRDFFRQARSNDSAVEVQRVDMTSLFDKTFRVQRGGEEVAWGKATVEQHLARIEFLKKLRNGIDDSIERHCRAVALIQERGVTCLEELGGVALDLIPDEDVAAG